GITGPGDGTYTDDFFFLDLTVPFSTMYPTNMPYTVLANVPIKVAAHTLVYSRTGMIYLFGGYRERPGGNHIYEYDITNNAWSGLTPNTVKNGTVLPSNSTTKTVGVIDSDLTNIYIFDNRTIYIYDTVNSVLSSIPGPSVLNYHGAVWLNTSEIAYIGGYNSSGINVPMDKILLYDTKSSVWTTKTAIARSGGIPSPRQGHTASIASDGRIFIYGGYDGLNTSSIPTFAVLEYINGIFEWSSPQLFNQSYVFRIYHTAHIIGNHLFINFGRNLTQSRLNTIDIINITNRDRYFVITNFIPLNYTTKPISANNIKLTSTSIILISVFGTIFGIALIVGCIFLIIFIRKKVEYKNSIIATPGSG
ncbi:7287_t:CDS:2, partial [Dentiscutata erythropus]